MKIRKLLGAIGITITIGAPISAEAQFVNPTFNPAGGFFAARPFTFRTFGNRFFVAQPLGFNRGFVTGNPYANLIGRGPLFVNANSPGVLGGLNNGFGPLATGFNTGAFPGALSPGLINSGAVLGGFVPGSPDPRLTNQSILNPFIDPSGGFINPALQGSNGMTRSGLSPIVTGSMVVPDPWTARQMINREIAASAAASTLIDASVPQNIGGLVTSRIVGDRLVLRYTGELSIVRSITFTLLDSSRRSLRMQISNRNPAEARLRLSSRARFYRVMIEYINGQIRTVEGAVDAG